MNQKMPNPGTIPGLLTWRSAATPHAVALQEETQGDASQKERWQATTWQELAGQVSKCQQALWAAGLRHGDHLALIAPVSGRWERLHHAALSLGVVVVGLDPHDLPERLAGMIEQADISAIASSSPNAVSAVGPQRLAACKLLLCLDGDAEAFGATTAWQTWAGFMHRADLAEGIATRSASAAVVDSDMATIIFTSGTTGAPKGISYSHGQVRLAVDAICDAFSFAGMQSRLLCWLPLSNLFQRMVNLAAMQQGSTTYLLGDPRRVMEVVAQVSPDIFIGVPRFYEKLHAGLLANLAGRTWAVRRLVQAAWQTGRRLRACGQAQRRPRWHETLAHALADRLVLRRVRAVMGTRLQCMVSGSAPMPMYLLEELHALGWLVLESYGTSENIVPMAMNRVDACRMGTVGKPVQGNEIQVDDGGNVAVRGPGVFLGYLGDTSEQNGAPDALGWYRTGDLGVIDSDGYLRLTGRCGDLIKTSTGRRIAPAGVEAALRSVQGIDQAMLLGAGRKCPVAICTCSTALPMNPASGGLTGALCAALAAVSAHDRPGAVALLPQAFSIELGELTPNLKLRRDVIARRHATLIDALYAAVETGHSTRPDVLVLN